MPRLRRYWQAAALVALACWCAALTWQLHQARKAAAGMPYPAASEDLDALRERVDTMEPPATGDAGSPAQAAAQPDLEALDARVSHLEADRR